MTNASLRPVPPSPRTENAIELCGGVSVSVCTLRRSSAPCGRHLAGVAEPVKDTEIQSIVAGYQCNQPSTQPKSRYGERSSRNGAYFELPVRILYARKRCAQCPCDCRWHLKK